MAGEADLQAFIEVIFSESPTLRASFKEVIAKLDGEGSGEHLGNDIGKGAVKGLKKGLGENIPKVMKAQVEQAYKEGLKAAKVGNAAILKETASRLKNEERMVVAAATRTVENNRERLKRLGALKEAEAAKEARRDIARLKNSTNKAAAAEKIRLDNSKSANKQAESAQKATQERQQVINKGTQERITDTLRAALLARLQTQKSNDNKQETAERNTGHAVLEVLKARLRRYLEAEKSFERDHTVLLDHRVKLDRAAERTAYSAGIAADRSKLQAQRAGDRQQLEEQRTINKRQLQAEQSGYRQEYVDQQASQARRTALLKAFLRTFNTVVKSGLSLVLATWKSHLEKRNLRIKSEGDQATALVSREARQQETATRLGLDRQNAQYSRAAQRRLRTIERTSAEETAVVTRGQVRQAEAVAAIRAKTQTGFIGAATGRSGIGPSLLIGASAVGGIAGILKTIHAASDLNESQNKFDVVFAKTTASARKSLQQFANSSATSLGISKQATLEATSTFGNLFTALKLAPDLGAKMSGTLVKLAADLASFNNKQPEDVLHALQSGIVGQAKPLRPFGISLSDSRVKAEAIRAKLVTPDVDPVKVQLANLRIEKATIDKSKAIHKYGADSLQARSAVTKLAAAEGALVKTLAGAKVNLTDAQKAQARFNIILQDSKLAQGDFARTAAALANTERIAAARRANTLATIGKVFLPIYLKAVTLVSSLLDNLVNGKGAFAIVRAGLIGLAAGLAAIAAAKAGVEVLGLLKAALPLIAANPIIAIAGALAILAGVIVQLTGGPKQIIDFFKALVEGAKSWIAVGYKIDGPIKGVSNIILISSTIGAAARVIFDALKSVGGAVSDLIHGGKFDDFTKKLGVVFENLKRYLGSLVEPVRKEVIKLYDAAREKVVALFGKLFDKAESFIHAGGIGKIAHPIERAIGALFGVARRAVVKYFGGLFVGVAQFVHLGGFGALKEILVTEVEIAVTAARKVVGDFFGSILHGPKIKPSNLTLAQHGESQDAGDANVAQDIGGRIHNIFAKVSKNPVAATALGSGLGAAIGGGLGLYLGGPLGAKIGVGLGAAIGGALVKYRKQIGPLFSKLGDWFAKTGGAAILKGLYGIGKFLGGPVLTAIFSKPVLKAVAAAAIALTAAAGALLLGFVEGLTKSVPAAVSALGDVLGGLVSTLGQLIGGLGKGSGGPIRAFLVIVGGAIRVIGDTLKFLGNQIAIVVSGISALFHGNFSGFVSKVKEGLGNLLRFIGTLAVDLIRVAKDIIVNFFRSMVKWIPTGIRLLIKANEAVKSALVHAFIGIIKAVVTEFTKLPGQIIRVIAGIPSAIKHLFDGGPKPGKFITDTAGTAKARQQALADIKTFLDTALGILGKIPKETPQQRQERAWNKVKTAIQGAIDTYQKFLDLKDGGKTQAAQARVSVGGDAAAFFSANTGDKRLIALSQAKSDAGTLIGQAQVGAGGNQAKLNSLIKEAKDKLLPAVLAELQDQNTQLGKNALSQADLTKKAKEFIDNVVGAPTVKPVLLDVNRQSLANFENAVTQSTARAITHGLGALGAFDPTKQSLANFAPQNAYGSIVRKKMLTWVGEDGPEVIIPLTKPARARQLASDSGLDKVLGDTALNVGLAASKAANTASVLKDITIYVKADPATEGLFKAFANATDKQKAGLLAIENAVIAKQAAFFKAIEDKSLHGISGIVNKDPAAAKFFESLTAAKFNFVGKADDPNHPRLTPAQLDTLATAKPHTATAAGHEFDRRLDNVITAIETHGLNSPLVGGNLIVQGKEAPKETASEVARRLRSQRYLAKEPSRV